MHKYHGLWYSNISSVEQSFCLIWSCLSNWTSFRHIYIFQSVTAIVFSQTQHKFFAKILSIDRKIILFWQLFSNMKVLRKHTDLDVLSNRFSINVMLICTINMCRKYTYLILDYYSKSSSNDNSLSVANNNELLLTLRNKIYLIVNSYDNRL